MAVINVLRVVVVVVLMATRSASQSQCLNGCVCSSPTKIACTYTNFCPRDIPALFTSVSLTGSISCGNTISNDSFYSLSNLQTLVINGFHNYQVMGDRPFANTRLSDLTIKNTSLETFYPGSLSGVSNLLTLDLSDNNIKAIPDYLFEELGQLKRLSLGNNQITVLSDNTFTGLVNLTVLDLSYNTIGTLSSTCFRPLTKLLSLKLSYNHISILPDGFLTGVPMASLFVDNNRITTIQPDAFTNSHLRAFNMANNSLTQFPGEALQKLPVQIQMLALSGNQIVKIGPGDAIKLNIVKLQLNDNPIKSVDPAAFTGSTVTGTLDLNNTQLTSLPKEILAALSTSSALQLGGLSGWNCDCDSVWLAEFLDSSATSTDPVCGNTGKGMGDSLEELELMCTTTTSTTTTTPTSTSTTTLTTVTSTSPSTMPTTVTSTPTTETTTPTFASSKPTSTSSTTSSQPTTTVNSSPNPTAFTPTTTAPATTGTTKVTNPTSQSLSTQPISLISIVSKVTQVSTTQVPVTSTTTTLLPPPVTTTAPTQRTNTPPITTVTPKQQTSNAVSQTVHTSPPSLTTKPITPGPVTPGSQPATFTPAPSTPGPVTPGPQPTTFTPAPVTPGSVTPGPQPVTFTPTPSTPGPVTHGPQPATFTPAPVTPTPSTPGPVTPGPQQVTFTPQPANYAPASPQNNDDSMTKLGLIIGTAMGLTAGITAMILAICVIQMSKAAILQAAGVGAGAANSAASQKAPLRPTSGKKPRRRSNPKKKDEERGRDDDQADEDDLDEENDDDPDGVSTYRERLYSRHPPFPRPAWLGPNRVNPL